MWKTSYPAAHHRQAVAMICRHACFRNALVLRLPALIQAAACRFYEMFEMDAFVGVECLGLQFMKGEQPHAGFPEAAYFSMAEQLARAGHRVVVVEQVKSIPSSLCFECMFLLRCSACSAIGAENQHMPVV